MGQPRNAPRLRAVLLVTALVGALLTARTAEALTPGGDATLTSDYIFRGISESAGDPALQLDLHVSSADGTFAGAFASTLRRIRHHGADDELQEYLGHHFDLSPEWTTTLTLVNYSYLDSNLPFSDDYQELSAALSYLDLWTVSVTASPNVPRYAGEYRLGRYTAYVTDASAQVPLVGRLFATAGLGHYTLNGPAGTSYVYGNAGLSFESGAWRIDAAYYVVQSRVQYLFPYGEARNRFALTLSWHF
ncbi:MAG TPA: TorF family putative porin [Steroidobacteraceae bacterium]|nr:TorF family putative porin [Steroidobacteraceae bacterium]